MRTYYVILLNGEAKYISHARWRATDKLAEIGGELHTVRAHDSIEAREKAKRLELVASKNV